MNPEMHRSRLRRQLALSLFALAAALPLGAAAQQSADEWKWSLTPYAWATDVGVDVAIGDRQLVDEEIPVQDLLEDLDTIAQLRVEAMKGRHGLFLDLFDVTLSDDAQAIALPGGAGSASLTPEMGMTIADLGGIFDPNGDGEGFQLLYGARILNERADIDVELELANGGGTTKRLEVNDTFVDALLGVRYIGKFGERWGYAMRADVSKGGTELTWSANPSLTYAFGASGRYTAAVGYRRMVVDFEAEDPTEALDATMTLSGPYLALRIGF